MEWKRRAPDVALCAAVAAANAYRIGTGVVEPGGGAVDGWAFALGAAMAVCLLGRRRRPALVMALVAALWLVYHLRDYPGGAPAVAVWVALYSVAVARRRRAGLGVAALLIVSDALARTGKSGVGPFDALLDGSTVVFVAMLLLGDAVRSRRVGREREAARVVAEERIRIARELHDVAAHTIAVIGVQSSVAAELMDDDPEQAREALEVVRRATSEAMGELRATVRVLRDEEDGTAPAPDLAGLPQLVRAYGDTGPRIALRTEGEKRAMPRLVELTAYRIVQEALANALRHGDPETVEVVVRYRDGGLDIEVRDDGGGTLVQGAGHGLRGMAERAAGLGGWAEAGAVGDGFRVRAWLPGGGTS